MDLLKQDWLKRAKNDAFVNSLFIDYTYGNQFSQNPTQTSVKLNSNSTNTNNNVKKNKKKKSKK